MRTSEYDHKWRTGIMRLTANFLSAKIDGAFKGTDREAVEMAYFLLRNDGIFVGPSGNNSSVIYSMLLNSHPFSIQRR